VELAQNREMMRAQTRSELAMGLVEILNLPADNQQLASIMRKVESGEPLTPVEKTQFRFRTGALFRYWENVHYQYRQGLYDASEYSAQRESWRRVVNASDAAANAWCDGRKRMSPAFATEVDALLERIKCE
jgi:hypothetical protein